MMMMTMMMMMIVQLVTLLLLETPVVTIVSCSAVIIDSWGECECKETILSPSRRIIRRQHLHREQKGSSWKDWLISYPAAVKPSRQVIPFDLQAESTQRQKCFMPGSDWQRKGETRHRYQNRFLDLVVGFSLW